MSGNSFELIMQEVLNQKQRMEDLLEENRDLRRQLTDLREGRGIFLEIGDKRFALVEAAVIAAPQVDPVSQDSPVSYQESAGASLNETPVATAPETPLPANNEFEQITSYLDHEVEEVQEEEALATHSSNLLNEMLIDEFASATTTQMATWHGSDTREATAIDEEEKAALRKELIGSFLLE